MENYKIVYKALDDLAISYDIVEHPAATTTEEADKFIEGKAGVRTKSLFLCDKKSTEYFLLIMDDSKRLDIKTTSEKLAVKGLKFCSPEKLMNKMGLIPGSVSLFGLLNNHDHDVKIYFDKEILSEEILTFHPNDNTKTLFIKTDDINKFLNSINFTYSIIDI